MDQKDHPPVVIYPPVGFVVALGGGGILHFVVPLGFSPGLDSVLFPLGLALIVLAALLAGSAILAFRSAGTNISPHHPALKIVLRGPYRLTRNPMYLGLVALLAGVGCAANSVWITATALPLWVVLHWGVVLREEAYLSAKFGPEYQALLARTRRWL